MTQLELESLDCLVLSTFRMFGVDPAKPGAADWRDYCGMLADHVRQNEQRPYLQRELMRLAKARGIWHVPLIQRMHRDILPLLDAPEEELRAWHMFPEKRTVGFMAVTLCKRWVSLQFGD